MSFVLFRPLPVGKKFQSPSGEGCCGKKIPIGEGCRGAPMLSLGDTVATEPWSGSTPKRSGTRRGARLLPRYHGTQSCADAQQNELFGEGLSLRSNLSFTNIGGVFCQWIKNGDR